MAQSNKTTKKIFQMAYGIGASIVILGALFKILHWEIDFGGFKLGGGFLLAFGLITEAIIFFISAFEPVEEGYDWSLVYPELVGGEARQNQLVGRGVVSQISEEDKAIKESLSEKLDNLLAEAQIDANLMHSLSASIQNFAGAAKEIAPVTDAMVSTHKYGEELSMAAAHLESLNSLYKLQLERTENQVSAQAGVVDNLNSLNEQMMSFKDNLKSLNSVYGGMLSAMGK
ncbi:type IX secretion system motor protein PorL/GldL [Capnocytophaga canimorsus]|uniref:Gliding motility protein GldL n=1 Tax=Capnocytophaga canimorsus TaxID=28188 RepID=A0A0B7HJG5_9FLAO|nr:gliding motility protein GldL [Capnocytophaga canimorsus]ATA77570.1 gliding motility protein GldL [Capnocytophaga canimorsus]ATA92115.1 gliding motility protein GldL [Capnocytophaga canimorsus]ATA94318.1 gliding motility protein GldL [Capnocytophaga canimorsus]AWL79042.1 gliding motility protein GldL [Capnocytophaga canimorsus]AYW37638.1 gliding motility protein GldL [Capnocytophaga canimorsus]